MSDMSSTGVDRVDTTLFRSVLSHFASGITIISALRDDKPVGLTCQSFFSLSLEPALVAFSVGRTSTSYPLISAVGSLTINILASGQEGLSNAFSRTGSDKWSGVPWHPSQLLGHPVIDGGVASLECDIESEIDAGDHLLVIARVRQLTVADGSEDPDPLLFYRGQYRRLHAILALQDEARS